MVHCDTLVHLEVLYQSHVLSLTLCCVHLYCNCVLDHMKRKHSSLEVKQFNVYNRVLCILLVVQDEVLGVQDICMECVWGDLIRSTFYWLETNCDLLSENLLRAVKAGSTFFLNLWMHGVLKPFWLQTGVFGSNKGNICVLCTLKINYKHFVSVEIAPTIVNKAVIHALRLQLFFKMHKVGKLQQFWHCSKAYHLENTNLPGKTGYSTLH